MFVLQCWQEPTACHSAYNPAAPEDYAELFPHKPPVRGDYTELFPHKQTADRQNADSLNLELVRF